MPRAGAVISLATSASGACAPRRSRGARPTTVPGDVPVKLEQDELELIERLVRQDRTAVSSAVLAIAGIGSGGLVRGAVLERVGEAACSAQSEGAISAQRGEQIARHVRRALEWTELGIAA